MALSFRREVNEAPVEALVFADGFADFDALAADMDAEFGAGQWEEIPADDTASALESAPSGTFAVIVVGSDLPNEIDDSAALIRQARKAEMTVLLLVGEISTRTTHRLMREGVAEFAPYPDSEGLFQEAVARLRRARSGNLPVAGMATPAREGRIITVYGVAGGVGASTFGVNLAWELAASVHRQGRKVALMDFNFQYGSIATYLDVPRREAVYELVSEASSLDHTGLAQALSTYKDRLHVLTAPRDALPLDIVSANDVSTIVNLAREAFDYVVIDLPQALMNWSEQVYTASDVFYAVMEIDMRSAQNMFRFLRTLKAEDMPMDTLQFVLNRAPGRFDLSGKTRVRRVAESLGVEFAYLLPDGDKEVMNACDQGEPLAEAARSNPLRKEIVKAAEAILEAEAAQQAAAATEAAD